MSATLQPVRRGPARLEIEIVAPPPVRFMRHCPECHRDESTYFANHSSRGNALYNCNGCGHVFIAPRPLPLRRGS